MQPILEVSWGVVDQLRNGYVEISSAVEVSIGRDAGVLVCRGICFNDARRIYVSLGCSLLDEQR